jgi:hypothetical protein
MVRWLGAAPSSDAPGTGRSGAEARIVRTQKKVGRSTIKGGPSQYPKAAALSRRAPRAVPGVHTTHTRVAH